MAKYTDFTLEDWKNAALGGDPYAIETVRAWDPEFAC
jgi:hypothetical protein